jgi:hypothetical protein
MFQLAVDRSTPTRRGFLKTMLAGGTALGLPNLDWLRHRAAAGGQVPRDTAVIQLWLGGGPSHHDTYDLKPNAPEGYRSPFRPIRTNVPGLDICELMPLQTRVMDRLALIRSLHHDHNGAHVPAIHCMQTGHMIQRFTPSRPSLGSVTAKARGANKPGVPAYVHITTDPKHLVEAPPMFDSAFLGTSYAPLKIRSEYEGEPWGPLVRMSTPSIELPLDMSVARLEDRAHLHEKFDALSRHLDAGGRMDSLDPYYQQAFTLLTSARARAAFDLTREAPRTRDRYGRNAWGQGTLLCRRLVEAGVTFVTLNFDSSSICWDHHRDLEKLSKAQVPVYDQLLTALIEDLVDRGLYQRVVVLVWAEFSRDPRFNADGGREHWGMSCFALLGGGGLKTGLVVGSTTAKGEVPKDRPVEPCDVHATLYRVLGIDPHQEFQDATKRPLPILSHGEAIKEVL